EVARARLAVEPVARVASVLVIERLADGRVCGRGVLAEHERGRGPRRSERAGHEDATHELGTDRIACHRALRQRGWVTTSIRYGSPRFTDAAPRSSAARSSAGSSIGPSLAMPYASAIFL